MKVFVHIGAPKAASTTLQHFFHFNNNINFLGIIRDHEDSIYEKKYDDDFHSYCRYKINDFKRAKKIKKNLSNKKINVISEEDFFTSQDGHFKKKIQRIIKIFPKCEFIVILRDPIETINSWHHFRIRGDKNVPLSIKSYVRKNPKNIIDYLNYEKRINYFKSLKKNKFHIINFNIIKQNKISITLEKIFSIKISNNKNQFLKKNSSMYFMAGLFKKVPLIKKLKFILPRFIVRFVRKYLLILIKTSKFQNKITKSESKFLHETFAREIKYYKFIFKNKDYFSLN